MKRSLINAALTGLQWIFFFLFWAGLIVIVIFVHPVSVENEKGWQSVRLYELFYSVIPDFDNQPWNEKISSGPYEFYVARKQSGISQGSSLTGPGPITLAGPGPVTGFAFVVRDTETSNPAVLLTGFDREGKATGVRVLRHPESQRLADATVGKSPVWKEWLALKNLPASGETQTEFGDWLESLGRLTQKARDIFNLQRETLVLQLSPS